MRELRWSRPQAANAFDEALVEELVDAVSAAAADEVRLLVLAGDGGRFSAGFDLRGERDDRSLAWRFARCEELLAAVRGFPGVTVASIAGPAYGAGADLAVCCDYRLGDETVRFRFPGPRFGVVLGTRYLASLVGRSRALDILLRNETVDARSALRDGLLTQVLESDDHGGFVRELASDMHGVDLETLRSLLRAARPAYADESLAELTRSTHRIGLADRVESYRAGTLRR